MVRWEKKNRNKYTNKYWFLSETIQHQ